MPKLVSGECWVNAIHKQDGCIGVTRIVCRAMAYIGRLRRTTHHRAHVAFVIPVLAIGFNKYVLITAV